MKKLSVSFVIIFFYYLLNGIEYAVILPTLNLYLLKLGGQPSFIGLVLSAFSLTGLISAPLFGHFTDKTRTTKGAVIVSNICEIAGNFLYFAAINPYMVLASRLIAGFGPGSSSSIYSMIARSTTEEERTATFSYLVSVRQVGLVIGPAFNLFLILPDFKIGPFHVYAYTVPGFFMCSLWTLHTICLIFFYRDFENLTANQHKTEKSCIDSLESRTNSSVSCDSSSSNEKDTCEAKVSGYPSCCNSVETNPVQTSAVSFWTFIYNDLVREEIVVCLFVTFVLMFVNSGIEALTTPLTQKLFNWEELPNSIFFFVTGILFIGSLFSLACISKRVSDRKLLLIGMVIAVADFLLYVVFIRFAIIEPIGKPWVLALFCIHSAIWTFNIAYSAIPNFSLFSKLTAEETQGINQGIRLIAKGIGTILGPLWVGYTLNYLVVMGGIFFALLAIAFVMVLASNKLLIIDDQSHDDMSEKTPLLSTKNRK